MSAELSTTLDVGSSISTSIDTCPAKVKASRSGASVRLYRVGRTSLGRATALDFFINVLSSNAGGFETRPYRLAYSPSAEQTDH